MSDWREVAEEGQIIYVHDEHGNIVKLGEQCFLALMPKVIKLGPFTDLEHAKSALTWKKKEIEALLEEFSRSLPGQSEGK